MAVNQAKTIDSDLDPVVTYLPALANCSTLPAADP